MVRQHKPKTREERARGVWVGKMCHYCNERPAVGVDHIIPRCKGGPNAQWNLVPCCTPCNQEKGPKRSQCECEKCAIALYRYDHGFFTPARNRNRNRMGSGSTKITLIYMGEVVDKFPTEPVDSMHDQHTDPEDTA